MLAALVGGIRPSGFAADAVQENAAGVLEHEAESEFSHIRIRKRGSVRSMIFVRDTGEEVLESQLDLRRPEVLRFEYLKFLFTSYLLRDRQEDVLIVGLGGGGMVHFLRHLDSKVRIDAVEIDPLVVRLADEYFDVRTGGNVNIITADGLKYLVEAEKKYDVIYMDAFLKPSADTDDTGAPLALRTRRFYEQVQQKLKPGGAVAFNLNPHVNLAADLQTIAEAVPQSYVFPLSRGLGAVAVGSTESERVPAGELVRRGRALDGRFDTTLSFYDLARRLRR